MKIIDFEKKGNVVRFYLGDDDCNEYYGDDWDDAPYEHNAGQVYDEFIKGYKDIAFDFDDVVLEPCDGELNSGYSKDDMIARKIPCITVIPGSYIKENNLHGWQVDDFIYALGIDCAKRYYFGDKLGE